MSYLGEAAALGASALWTGSYIAFTFAVRRLGADVVNRVRLAVALGLLLVTHAAVYGTPVPLNAPPARWFWLCLSGVVGFAVCDAFLFRALFHLGAHRTALVSALIPVVSALFAWGTLGQRLLGVQWVGVVATVCALALVVSARETASDRGASRRRGLAFALIAVVAQSARYLLSVKGMEGGFPPLSTNVIQILAATVAAWLAAIARGRWRDTWVALRDWRGARATMAGAFVGPFLGVTASLVALTHAPVGIASTLMALPPVFLLPLSRIVFRERIAVRAIVGTVLAVGGVSLLFLG